MEEEIREREYSVCCTIIGTSGDPFNTARFVMAPGSGSAIKAAVRMVEKTFPDCQFRNVDCRELPGQRA